MNFFPQIFKQTPHANIVYLLCGILCFVAIALVSAVLVAGEKTRTPELYFLSVGQGDSSLIQLPGDIQILIDGGPDGRKLLENLSKILPAEDRYIDLVIMTHPQLDHFGGFIELLKKYRIGAFAGSMRKGPIAAYQELHSQIESNRAPYIQLLAGDSIRIGDTRLSILSPSIRDAMSKELNDSSLVVLLEHPQIKALYTGDIDSKLEERLIKKYDLNIDVLKVAHHGSRFSSGNNFLKKITPTIAVIEVGKNNYGHPTKQALERLKSARIEVFRTDTQGILKVVPKSNQLDVWQAF